MLDEKAVQRESKKFENKVKGIFKKYGLGVDVLDKNKDDSRPDFFVFKKNNKEKGFVCECKFVASVGTLDDGKYHISTFDPKLGERNKGGFQFSSFGKIKNKIREALSQYQALIEDKPSYKKFPFVVVLKLDFFANSFGFIPKNIYGLPKISAVMKIERNIKREEEIKKWSKEELKKVIEGKLKKKIPPESIQFKVLRNSNPVNPFKAREFLRNPIILHHLKDSKTST